LFEERIKARTCVRHACLVQILAIFPLSAGIPTKKIAIIVMYNSLSIAGSSRTTMLKNKKKGVDYKPGSVSRPAVDGTVTISLWIRVAPNLLRPTRVKGWAILAATFGSPLFGLAPDGVCRAPVLPRDW